jgi:UDP-N-acetylmuramoyl-L-alanyl-D-glutamate--2,6-diaminopimelate ligase
MLLRELVAGLPNAEVNGDASVDVTAVTHDSRLVTAGALFCCVPGRMTDGHEFARAAADAGAVALLCERTLELDIAQVVIPDVRAVMGSVASTFHGHPSQSLDVIGVTGTNGKTTVTHFLHAILEAAGRPSAVIGTLGGPRTTPEATDLQAQLATLRDSGVRAVAMEVSSHALSLDRVAGTHFRVAVFTNLSRDHLDFHGTMEDYFSAKAQLFEPRYSERAVVNADDKYGDLLAHAAAIPTTTFSLHDVEDLHLGRVASTGAWRGQQIVVPFGGAFNVSNALAALTTAAELGIDLSTAIAGLAAAPPVPGRYEIIDAGQPFTVIVDFAHTPDGIEQVLRAARTTAAGGRVIAVFGAGGDKDRDKRPLMGEAGARLADTLVVTSDNPRSEDPAAIAAAVVGGTVQGGAQVRVELDRRAAIALALAEAGAGDVVVVAGKGHETTQTIGDQVHPFDDRQVVRDLLQSIT